MADLDALLTDLADRARVKKKSSTHSSENENVNSAHSTFGEKLEYQRSQRIGGNGKPYKGKSIQSAIYGTAENHTNTVAKSEQKLQKIISEKQKSEKEKSTKKRSVKRILVTKTGKNGPMQKKIYNTPPPLRAKFNKSQSDNAGFDPRFDSSIAAAAAASNRRGSDKGWQLRKAYSFLDDCIKRDVEMVERRLKKCKNDYIREALSKELTTLRNRQNLIKERDLQQSAKSQLRKEDIAKVRSGDKNPFFYKVNPKALTLNGLKYTTPATTTTSTDNSQSQQSRRKVRLSAEQSMKNKILEKKYEQLSKEGRLEKYMRKKRQKINTKYRVGLNKKTAGKGWNDHS